MKKYIIPSHNKETNKTRLNKKRKSICESTSGKEESMNE